MTGGQFRHTSISITIVIRWIIARHRRVLARYLLLVATSVSIAATSSVLIQNGAPTAGSGVLNLAATETQSAAVEKQTHQPP